MQPRTLDQILTELQPSYQPSIDFLRQRQTEIPRTVEADIQAAQGAQTQAYEDILTGARRRGLGFSGIPLGEQARYASQVFAPEVLRARTRGTEAARDLEGTILGIQGEIRNAAIARRQREQDIATELANASRGGGGSENPTLAALIDWLRGNQKVDNQDNRTPLSDIFGGQQQPLQVSSTTNIPVGRTVQPTARVNLQGGTANVQAPSSVNIGSSAVRLQGGGATQGRTVSVSPYQTPRINYVTGPAPGLQVR